MTKHEFLAVPPIEVVMGGQKIILKPKVQPAGACIFQSDPIKLMHAIDGVWFDITGTFTITVKGSQSWIWGNLERPSKPGPVLPPLPTLPSSSPK